MYVSHSAPPLSLKIDSVEDLPGWSRVTRAGGEWYHVRTLRALGKSLKREAKRYIKANPDGVFRVRDANGNVSVFDQIKGAFNYEHAITDI